MISELQAFLIQAAGEQQEKEIDIRGKKFKIRAITMDEWEDIQKRSANPESKERVSSTGILKRTAIEGCVEPNYKEEEFIKACGVQTPMQALVKTLKAGEITKIGNAVLKFSGFGEDVEKARQEAQE